MSVRRRLLIVTDSVCGSFSAIKRAHSYRGMFEQSESWSATYIDRNTPRAAQSPPLGKASIVRRMTRRLFKNHSDSAGETETFRARESHIVDMARSYDAVYLVKVPGVTLLRELAAIPGLRVLMDFNDTIWLPWQKASAWEGLEEMISIADGIVCENQFVAEYARRFNPVVHLVPDCAQVAVFDDLRGSVARNEDTVRLGWIGSAGTASSLYRVWEPLEALSVRYPQVELRILGASPEHLPRFEHVKWSTVSSYDQKTMVREALAMDVGIFPLFHVTESIGRGNGKTVLYMAAEAATVSEGIGENVQLIKDGVNGLLASTSDEWLAKLDWLVAHREDRRRIARAGLQTVREELSDLSCFSQLIGALDSVMESSTAEETHRGRV